MKKTLVWILVVVLSFSFVGCGTQPEEKEDTFRVVTSFYPLYISVLNITDGAENIEVVNMAGQQVGCLHDYQLQNKDIKALETADVFVINGAGMESFLDKVVEQLPSLSVVNASEGMELLEGNPHVWVSLSGCAQQVGIIANALAEADPQNGETYQKNALAYQEKILALKDKVEKETESLPHKQVITMHEAFPYFAKEFGLEIVGVVNREPDSQPSAQELAETIDLVNELGVKAVFAEPQYESSAADTIAQNSCAEVYTLDPVVTGENSKDAYLTAMEKNLEVLKKALA